MKKLNHHSLMATVALAVLAACGGGTGDKPATTQTRTSSGVHAPLLDDEGRPQLTAPDQVPADTGARTRLGLYATEAQAQDLEASLGSKVISTRVEPDADRMQAADLAVLVAYGLQAAHDLDTQAPVLVRGSDQRLAATVVNRLHDNGFQRVFLVTR